MARWAGVRSSRARCGVRGGVRGGERGGVRGGVRGGESGGASSGVWRVEDGEDRVLCRNEDRSMVRGGGVRGGCCWWRGGREWRRVACIRGAGREKRRRCRGRAVSTGVRSGRWHARGAGDKVLRGGDLRGGNLWGRVRWSANECEGHGRRRWCDGLGYGTASEAVDFGCGFRTGTLVALFEEDDEAVV